MNQDPSIPATEHRLPHGARLALYEGDLTRHRVDALVNAANAALAGGGGVDGAIHRAGGPEIMEETRRRYPAGCPTGSAVISTAGKLAARYVIHAVGPIWRGGTSGEPHLLASAHRRSLELAAANDCRSIAFPAISTGVYGYPLDVAAEVALSTALEFLAAPRELSEVRFVLFGSQALLAFQAVLDRLSTRQAGQ